MKALFIWMFFMREYNMYLPYFSDHQLQRPNEKPQTSKKQEHKKGKKGKK